MTLEPALAAHVDPQLHSRDGLAAVGFGLCFPGDSALSSQLALSLEAGQSPAEAALANDLPWNPRWLLDAGYSLVDASDQTLRHDSPAMATGSASWVPTPRLCRVDDQVKDNAKGKGFRRRLAGEVALLALWTAAVRREGIDPSVRPDPALDGGARGARFKNFLVHTLRRALPEGWTVEPEVPLITIRGLHMRRNVGNRKSDIVVIDPDRRLVAVVSSKWTWRSDRGTEAAQMVPLMKYRPDVPYAMVTAEFPRALTVSRESIEDRAYHLVPRWAAAWHRLQSLDGVEPRDAFPDLRSLQVEGTSLWRGLDLPDLYDLVADLTGVGLID